MKDRLHQWLPVLSFQHYTVLRLVPREEHQFQGRGLYTYLMDARV